MTAAQLTHTTSELLALVSLLVQRTLTGYRAGNDRQPGCT